MADRYAARLGPPWLIVVRGLSGTGKSTLAAALSERLGTELLQTDQVRRQLFPGGPAGDADGQRYRPANRAAVYDELFRRADDLAEQGMSVILDGTFLAAETCARAVQLAVRHREVPLILRCHCSRTTALRRIEERLAGGHALSEATVETYQCQKGAEEPAPLNVSSWNVDTDNAVPEMLNEIIARLKPMTRAWCS